MLLGWGQPGAFEPGLSLPPDHMFILRALIEEQHRLIFMEKKTRKAEQGRGGGWGRSLVLVIDSMRSWQGPPGSAHPTEDSLGVGRGAGERWGFLELWTPGSGAGKPLLGPPHPGQRPEWASLSWWGEGRAAVM